MSSSSSSPMTMNLSDESSRRDILDAAMRYLPENQSSASRNLKAYPPIAGYQPISQVGDHVSLDYTMLCLFSRQHDVSAHLTQKLNLKQSTEPPRLGPRWHENTPIRKHEELHTSPQFLRGGRIFATLRGVNPGCRRGEFGTHQKRYYCERKVGDRHGH